MNRLQFIAAVWGDLDVNYALYNKATAVKLTKREYLEQLIDYNPAAVGSTILTNYLATEVETYTAEEYKLYESLIMLFNKVFDRLKNYNGAIKNLSDFVQEEETLSEPKLGINQSLENFVFNPDDYRILNNTRVFVTPDVLHSKGFLTNAAIIENGAVKSYAVKNTDGYRIIKDAADLNTFLRKSGRDTLFYKKCYAAIMQLARINKLKVPLIIMSSKYFTVTGKTFTAGIVKHSCEISDETSVKFKTLTGKTYEVSYKAAMFRIKGNDGIYTVIGVY